MRSYWVIIVIACFLAGCLGANGCLGEQKIENGCESYPCPSCSSDDECHIVSNPCHETGQCVHVDLDLDVTGDGCNYSYDVPSDEICKCVEETCKVKR